MPRVPDAVLQKYYGSQPGFRARYLASLQQTLNAHNARGLPAPGQARVDYQSLKAAMEAQLSANQ